MRPQTLLVVCAILASFFAGLQVCLLKGKWTSYEATTVVELELNLPSNPEKKVQTPPNIMLPDTDNTSNSHRTNWPGKPMESMGNKLVSKGVVNFVNQARVSMRSMSNEYSYAASKTISQLWPEMEEFLTIYNKRPDKTNMCGIRINHAFALFLTVKALGPTSIIESGINAGVSTYIMRRAAPKAKIYAIDPLDHAICGQGKRWMDDANNTNYLTGKNFRDIKDVDWASLIRKGEIDPEHTLVFLDDHLEVYFRIGKIAYSGFRHVILEDNYKAGEGATKGDRGGWTPKQMFARPSSDADVYYLWNNMIRYAEIPPLVPPSITKGEFKRKAAGGFLHPTDDSSTYVEPFLRPDVSDTDRKIYDYICERLGIDPDIRDMESYMQIMNYNYIAYFELVPMSPQLRDFKG